MPIAMPLMRADARLVPARVFCGEPALARCGDDSDGVRDAWAAAQYPARSPPREGAGGGRRVGVDRATRPGQVGQRHLSSSTPPPAPACFSPAQKHVPSAEADAAASRGYAPACHTPPMPFREEALVPHEACRVTAALNVMHVSDMLRAGCSGACWKRAGAARCSDCSGATSVQCTCCTSAACYAASSEVLAA